MIQSMHWAFLLAFVLLVRNDSICGQAKKETIAVIDFSPLLGVEPGESIILTNRLRSALSHTQEYIVLERKAMNVILAEQDFSISENCSNSECAVRVGQMLAAQKVILGDVGKLGRTYAIHVRLIDVSTGSIEKSTFEEYRGDSDGLLKVIAKIATDLSGVSSESVKDWLAQEQLKRITIQIHTIVAAPQRSFRKFVNDGDGFGVSIGYWFSSRLHATFTIERIKFKEKRVIHETPTSPYHSYHYGIVTPMRAGVQYYPLAASVQPFVQIGFGYETVKIIQTNLGGEMIMSSGSVPSGSLGSGLAVFKGNFVFVCGFQYSTTGSRTIRYGSYGPATPSPAEISFDVAEIYVGLNIKI